MVRNSAMKKWFWGGLLLIALVFRLYLTDKAWHVDMLSNAAWGERVYEHGTESFYDNNVWTYAWPTQPPLINSIYGFNKKMYVELLGRFAWIEFQLNKVLPGEKVPMLGNFVDWYGYGRVNLENPFQIGFLVTMKFIPVIADIGIAWLIFEITKKQRYVFIYLVSPFSWYVSSLWGQYDSVGAFFALGAFWTLLNKWRIISPTLLVVSALIKPTSLILIPFYGYVFGKKFPRDWRQICISLIIPVVVFWITTAPYTHKNPFEFARYDLTRIVFEKSEPRVGVNAFNMWRIFTGDKPINSTQTLWLVSWQTVGNMLVAIINGLAIWISHKRKDDKKTIWGGVFLVAAGTWITMTGMMDRYLYFGMVSGLIATTWFPKTLKYWIGMSIIFWINLFYHWWIPENFGVLKEGLLWKDGIVTNGLSLAMLVLAGKFMYTIVTDHPANQSVATDQTDT